MQEHQAVAQQGTILVVDDTPDNLRLLLGILAEHGYTVRPAPSGELALNFVTNSPPDLILLDIKMPGLNGYEVCNRLKTDERTRNIPVIFLSALDEVADKLKGFAVGGVDYITKPFQAEEVLVRIKTHLTLQHLQNHLEELVVQRTRELQQANAELQQKNIELERAQEAANIANRAKNEFIANISHELRTPLSGILGYAEVLTMKPEGKELKEEIEIVYQCGRNLLVIINDLIDLSKIEAGKMAIKAEVFYLSNFLQGLLKMFHIQTQQHAIEFHHNFATDLPEVMYGDQRRLRQILLNLLGNAFKFTKEGEVIFKVTKIPEESEVEKDKQPFDRLRTPQLPLRQAQDTAINLSTGSGHRNQQSTVVPNVRFEVKDTGIGIPPEQLDKIFAPFHQIGDKRLAQTTGMGLGLTVSQRLIRMMGSELHVQSTPGQGSTFWFDLQLTDIENE